MSLLDNTKDHDQLLPEDTSTNVLIPAGASAFLTLVSDSLRLRDETLSMAFVYIHKYHHYLNKNSNANNLLDDHTLVLASLSLATKGTESPRRVREFLLPAYEVVNPTSPPLSFPSPLYDSLRLTLVDAELLLLRILKFDIRLPLPYDYLHKALEKVLTLHGADHLEFLDLDEKDEIAISNIKETSLGRVVWALVGEAMRNSYDLVNFFTPRTVAIACVYFCIKERSLRLPVEDDTWLRIHTGDKVDYEDFIDAVNELRNMKSRDLSLEAI